MNPLKTLFLLAAFGFFLIPAGFSDDYGYTGQPRTPSLPKNSYGNGAGNWDKALNSQRQVDRLVSSGRVSGAGSYGQVTKKYAPAQIYDSEHIANPLSRPDSDPLIAVRQANQALQSAQLAAPSEEENSEDAE